MVRLGLQPLPSNTDWIGFAYALARRTLIRVYFGVKEGLSGPDRMELNQGFYIMYISVLSRFFEEIV